jgi:hypothetical protein
VSDSTGLAIQDLAMCGRILQLVSPLSDSPLVVSRPAWIAVALAAGTAAGTVPLLASPAHAADNGPISAAAPTTISVDPSAGKPTTLTLENSSEQPVKVGFTTLLDKGNATVKPTTTTVPAFGTKRVDVVISSTDKTLSTSGDFVVTPIAATSGAQPKANGPSAAVELTLKPLIDYVRTAWLLVGGALVAAFLVVRRCWVRIPHRWAVLLRLMGPVGWDFSTSWASNITVVGAVLGTVLSASVLPHETHYISKDGYTILNLLFGIIVVAAPFVFSATRIAKVTPGAVPKFKGLVLGFLAACLFTLWGVLGELATVGLIFREIQLAGSFPSSVVYLLYGLLVIAIVLTYFYAVGTTGAIIESQGFPKPGKRSERRKAEVEESAAAETNRRRVMTPLDSAPEWKLL